MSSSSGNGKGFVCPFPGCERVFTKERGMKRHYNYEHAGGREEAAEPAGDWPSPDALAQLGTIDVSELAAPLHSAIARYERRLTELELERRQIQEAIRPVKAAIASLEREHAKPGPKGKRAYAQNASQAKIDAVREAIVAAVKAGELDEFTTTEALRVGREKHGLSMHETTFRLAIATLHESGLLRAVRRTVGGGQVFALVAGESKPYPPDHAGVGVGR